MHLDNKSLAVLISPFVLSVGVWLMGDVLVEPLKYFFEPVQPAENTLVDEKGLAYQFFTQHKEEYTTLLHKIQKRHENRFWISERLYWPYTVSAPIASTVRGDGGVLLPPPALLKLGDGNISMSGTPTTWSVQMVMPDQNIAIINNKIYHVGQSFNGIKLLSVENSKIHIQTAKGSQWVKLFQ
jgi:hypothetical protein